MPNKCLHRVRLQILGPKKTFTTQNEWKFWNKIVSIQTTQQQQKKIKHTHAPKKKTHKTILKHAHKREQIFGKLWAKMWNNKRQNLTHT